MTLTFLLDYQQISRTDKSIVVAGSVNYLRAKFSPKSDDWQLPVTALFNDMAVLLDENWECAVPWEVVQQAGQFTVSAFCGSLQTANTVTVPVVASGYKNGETPPEPTPDVYNQILGVMQDAKDAAETAQEAAGIAQDAAEHAPTIIDGVWHEWDAEAGEYKSTGTHAQGPEGKQGPKGDKGDRGDKGDKGDTGATGAQGPAGPTGETGPVGPQGEKGDTGSQGPQGVPGTAATITIGTVTESAPGGDASVTNSGTATAAVLDFVIPRGETGPTGATGATGPAGLGVPSPTAEDAGKVPMVNADGSGYELGNPAPEVDNTLSLPGSPADAAATGQAIEAVSPDDETVGAKPWSSKQIIDTLCPPLEVTGNPVQCYPVAGYPLGVKASWEPRQSGEGDPSPENIRPITGLDEVNVTLSDGVSDGATATLTLPETIYGGTVDAVTGEGMETWKTRVLNGSESWGEADDGAFYFYDTIAYPNINAVSSRMCSHFIDYSGAAWTGLPNGYFSTNGVSVRFRIESIADVAAWKSYLAAQAAAGTPVTIAYKLATPTTFQATGNQALPAVAGLNTLYTDADSVTVTGRADPNHTINALNERIAALEDAATGG